VSINPASLQEPFAKLLEEEGVTDPFILHWLDMICFLLQGTKLAEAPTSLMAYMLSDFYREGVVLDFPKGGTKAIVDALVRGVTKHDGCEVLLNTHVASLVVEGGRAAGVRTSSGEVLRAERAVISNCDLWSTRRLVASADDAACAKLAEELDERIGRVERCGSFLHLHVGIDGDGLPSEPSEAFPAQVCTRALPAPARVTPALPGPTRSLPRCPAHTQPASATGLRTPPRDRDPLPRALPQWASVRDWKAGVDAPRNMVLVSVASLLDPSLAPPGCHVVHAYTPATEPYAEWDGLDRTSREYKTKKEEAAKVLWEAIEKQIPDARQRAKVALVGTPLTHERFLRRDGGTYGPLLRAGDGLLPGQATCLPGLVCCGDSTFPGIGMPAVAASGLLAASSIVPVTEHWKMLDRIKL
jgi:phytoene dehydrogenase-like protein